MDRRSGTKQKQEATPAVETEAAALPAKQAKQAKQAERAAEPGKAPEVDPGAFAQLSAQVTQLQGEMEALRKELEALRSAAGELSIEEAA